jgi:hypothetical protein
MSEHDHEDEMKERLREYAPSKLPTSITRTVYVCYGIGKYNSGRISIEDRPAHASEEFGRVLLTQHKMTFKIPRCKIDIKSKMLEILEEEKRKVIADNHMRLKAVEDKISNILAIEYQSE